MKQLLKIVLLTAVLFPAAFSCTRTTKVIPRDKFVQIYCEMFLADQWLEQDEAYRRQADTTWFYAPIFERFGYTTEAYRASVEHYLRDPQRYTRLMEKVSKHLLADADRLNGEFDRDHQVQQARNAFSRGGAPDVCFREYRTAVPVYERFRLRRNDKGIYVPEIVPADTLFSGPELIIQQDSL